MVFLLSGTKIAASRRRRLAGVVIRAGSKGDVTDFFLKRGAIWCKAQGCIVSFAPQNQCFYISI